MSGRAETGVCICHCVCVCVCACACVCVCVSIVRCDNGNLSYNNKGFVC